MRSLLDGVADDDPAALGTRDCATNHDEATFLVDLGNDEVLRRDALIAQVTGHLLALEHLARVLALTGRTVCTVGDRDAVGGAETAEVPALHGALETFTLGGARHVDELA